VGDFISGACVGTVVALSDDFDPGMRHWLGAPCLQPLPAGLPLSREGKIAMGPAAKYAAKLWWGGGQRGAARGARGS
jgi:hypothetical protein